MSVHQLVGRLANERPDLITLAEALSPAVSIERPLLRRARLRFVPRSTAGLEAELWFSPLVEAAGETLVLDPEAAEVLRGRLAGRSPRYAREVRALVAQAHTRAPLVLRTFEELLWAGVFPGEVPEQQIAGGWERLMGAVAADRPGGDDLSRWVLHYAPRLPEAALRSEPAWQLQVASAERLGVAPPFDHYGHGADATLAARSLVHRPVRVGVSAAQDGIVLSRPPDKGARVLHAAGGRLVRLDVRSTLAHHREPARLELREGERLHLPFTVVQKLSSDGDRARMSLAHPGAAVATAVSFHPAGAGAAQVAVLLPDDTIILHDSMGEEIRRIPAAAAPTQRSRLALSADGTAVYWFAGGAGWQCRVRADAVPGRLVDRVPESLLRDSAMAEVPEEAAWVEPQLPFRARQSAQRPGHARMVAGVGGPVEVTTEDGVTYLVRPEVSAPEDGLPSWARGGVIAAVAADTSIETLSEWLDAVTVEPDSWNEVLTGTFGEFVPLVEAAHQQGTGVLLDVRLRLPNLAGPPVADLLAGVRAWLELGGDGVRVVDPILLKDEALVEDLRHLASAYDGRIVLQHAVFPTANAVEAAVRLRPRSPETHHGEYECRVVPAARAIGETDDRVFKTALAMSQPGWSMLPADLLHKAGAVRTMAEQRRNQRAFLRGGCRVLDLGSGRDVLALLRLKGDERVLCLANFAARPGAVTVTPEVLGDDSMAPGDDAIRLLDLLDSTVPPTRLPATLELAPRTVRWFQLHGAAR
jgi:hypothetical protein